MPNALLWDLNLGNVELRATSPLPPPTVEDVHLQPPVPGHISSQELIHSIPILSPTYSILP
ncbi:uncharacterized protein C8R40DRAFT_1178431 [Lentinula edodes]|uniref:uncharacterized protein n=1 Tax=Lentinula edodes TaxID=5353 RepID=UPI001E8E61E5|nr:uncharacterized protein C8R40DRAFT_1178431 [Lentinula edodes]KAH7867946.1 hypothetical protein C8R40DRAFT_1178431 [Lentinula edodes]